MTPKAAEKRSFLEVMEWLEEARNYARTLSARLEGLPRWNKGRRVLELGAAAGCLTIALNEIGYDCIGIEPDPDSLRNAEALARELNCPCPVVYGCAEDIPFPHDSFDMVVANSVLEHVSDIEASFREVARVLSPGGLFWFFTASSMCPFQEEIAKFPLFGWYPDAVKRRIMWWAVSNRPELIGYTLRPAINWFSDRRVARELSAAGFINIRDRWDLRRPEEGGWIHRSAVRFMQSRPLLKRAANAWVQGCAYAAERK